MIIEKILINALAIFIASQLLNGVILNNFLTAIIVSIVLGLINTFIKPIFLLLTLPINILTLGLFTFIINALMILIASSLVKGFLVENIGWALILSLLISIFNSILNSLFK